MRKPPPIWISSPREMTTSLRRRRAMPQDQHERRAAQLLTTVAASAPHSTASRARDKRRALPRRRLVRLYSRLL